MLRTIAIVSTALMFALSAHALTLQEERGKQIYAEGTSPSGETITAYVGAGSTPIPANAVPCGSCHGADGRGRPEGGVIPSNVTWRYLTKRYGHSHPYGRTHPAFTEDTVKQAIAVGTDPAGNRLERSMPRYTMTEPDFADLIAYLKRLEGDLDPGVTESEIRLGTLLPLQGRLGEIGRAMQGIMQAYFDELNAHGGIYGRRVELVVADYTGDPVYGLGKARALIEQESVFALVSAFTAGMETDMAQLTEEAGIPLVGPFTLFPQESFTLNRFTFYLLSGLREQARALVEYAVKELGLDNPTVAVIHPGTEGYKELAEAIKRQAKDHDWADVLVIEYAPGEFDADSYARDLQAKAVQAIFFLGSGRELTAFLARAETLEWQPYVLLPGALAGRAIHEMPAVFADRVLLSYPNLPSDQSEAGAGEFQALQRRYKLDARHRVAQISAFTAAKIMVEALKRSGKDLSREKLVRTLEGFYQYQPGLTPAISYGPNRRIGAMGAYVVAVDLENKSFKPVSGWIGVH